MVDIVVWPPLSTTLTNGFPKAPGLEDVSRFPHLIAELLRRGWSERHVAGIAGLNFIRHFRAVEKIR